jgi:glutamyl-tRNA synthetase
VPWAYVEEAFRLEDVNLSPAFFDLKKLDAFNGEYIRMLRTDELIEACEPWLPPEWDRGLFARIAPFIQERLVRLSDAPGWIDFLFLDDPEIDETSWGKTMTTDYALPLLSDAVAAYQDCPWQADDLKAALEQVMVRYGLKLGKAQAPVRVAVTGRTVGPPLFETLEVMGAEESLRRMRAALERLGG